MSTYPTTPRSAFLQWTLVHVPVFTTNAADIGLTSEQAAAFASAVEEAAAAEEARAAAAQAAKTATQNASMKFAALRTATSSTVGLIKAFAANTNDPRVYNLAEIPAPKPATPLPAPGMPTDLTVSLQPSTGQIEIRWKAVNPKGATGTAYIVRRRTGSASAPFEFVGVTGEKKFVDSTFIAGPDRVEYTIQGQRSDKAGPVSNILVINFGVPGSGGMGGAGFTVSTIDSPEEANNFEPVKMAA